MREDFFFFLFFPLFLIKFCDQFDGYRLDGSLLRGISEQSENLTAQGEGKIVD
jgi:hypothetical protein